jgi:hypothetical protein
VAKKKSRVPTPPKRSVQAPKPYQAPRDPRRTRMILIAAGVALLIAAAGAAIAFAVGRGGGEESAVSGPCVRKTFPSQGEKHVTELPEGFKYNSVPATSGPMTNETITWNLYDRGPLNELSLVHNLEHGGIAVQYGPQVPQATVQKIADWYAEDPNGMVVAPLPALGKNIALTAWTHLATCSAFDEDAFSDFRDDYRGANGDAPEGAPPEQSPPGGQ